MRIPCPPKLCRTCGVEPSKRGGECGACSEYRRRTGEQRPLEVIWKAYTRRLDRELTRQVVRSLPKSA